MVPNRTGTFEGHDGTRLYFEEYGSGPAVLLANGIICTIQPYWQFQIPHLAERARVIAWDYRGHGRSSVPADIEASGVEDHSQDLLCLLDHLEVDRAVLVGHSMGVQVILETMLRAPERAAGLIAVAGTYGKPFSTMYDNDLLELIYDPLLRWARDHHVPIGIVTRFLARTPLPQVMARTGAVHWYLAPWELMNAYFEHCFSLDVRFALTAMRHLGAHSAEAALERIQIPTLIVAGAKDPFAPKWVAEDMHQRIAGAELLMIRNGTHVPQIEHPDLVNLRIEKFLEDHGIVESKKTARKAPKRAVKKPKATTPAAKPKRSSTKKKAAAKKAPAAKAKAKRAPAKRKSRSSATK